MSIEDLKKLGVHSESPGVGDSISDSSAGNVLFALSVGTAVIGCVLMALGDGGLWTWLGLVCFFAGLVAFIAMNLRSVRIDSPPGRRPAESVEQSSADSSNAS